MMSAKPEKTSETSSEQTRQTDYLSDEELQDAGAPVGAVCVLKLPYHAMDIPCENLRDFGGGHVRAYEVCCILTEERRVKRIVRTGFFRSEKRLVLEHVPVAVPLREAMRRLLPKDARVMQVTNDWSHSCIRVMYEVPVVELA